MKADRPIVRLVIGPLISMLALVACASTSTLGPTPAETREEVAALVALDTPDSLALAALTSALYDPDAGRSVELMTRSQDLAPDRPELVWMRLRLCEQVGCDDATRLEDRLKALDPDNGIVWARDLQRAWQSGSDPAITDALLRMATGSRISVYWNTLETEFVDALSAADASARGTHHSRNLASRGMEAIGTLSAFAIPPLQSIGRSCQLDQFDRPGRRAACEALAARLEQSSIVLTQSLALSMQERWWPAGTLQRSVVDRKRRRLDYLLQTSNRSGWWTLNRDMAVLLEAARHHEREEDVVLALVKSFGLPSEPPDSWKKPAVPR